MSVLPAISEVQDNLEVSSSQRSKCEPADHSNERQFSQTSLNAVENANQGGQDLDHDNQNTIQCLEKGKTATHSTHN